MCVLEYPEAVRACAMCRHLRNFGTFLISTYCFLVFFGLSYSSVCGAFHDNRNFIIYLISIARTTKLADLISIVCGSWEWVKGFFSLPPPTKDPPARIVIMSYIDLTCLKDEKNCGREKCVCT